MKNDDGIDTSAYAGVHSTHNRLWAGYNLDNDKVLTAIAGNEYFGAFALASDNADGTSLAVARFAYGNKSGLFTPDTADFVMAVLTGKQPRPTFRDFSSFTREGELTAQVLHNKDKDADTYTQVEVGKRFGDFGIGAGYRFGDGSGIVGQLDYTTTVGDFDLGATIRAQDGVMASFDITYRWY